MSQQGCSSPRLVQKCWKVIQRRFSHVGTISGHMLRFPGEGGCVEMFEHRHYGDLLCVFELTAMTAVNLKVEGKEECKDSPRIMFCEYKFKNIVLCCSFLVGV